MGKKVKKQDGKNVSFDAFFTSPPCQAKGGSQSQIKKAPAEKMATEATVLEEEPKKKGQTQIESIGDDAGSTPAPPLSPTGGVIIDMLPAPFRTKGGPAFIVSNAAMNRNKQNILQESEPIAAVDQPAMEPDISSWNFDETTNKPRILNDGFVYYCRACRRHYKGPVILNLSPNQEGFYDLKSCPLCGTCESNKTDNETTEKEGTCETCGCKLGLYYNEMLTKEPTCFNCNRDLVEKYLKIKE